MENRAPYALIGLFVLAAIAAVFGFVYWLNSAGGLGARTIYQVRFENTVSGLLTGAAVLFNGIRIGEVTDLRLNPDNPNQVTATIAVAVGTPVRPDTQASLDFQGLTGVPVVTLQGGSAPADSWPQGQARTLNADPQAGQSMTRAARDTLRNLNDILNENSKPLHETITNVQKFADALGRNSNRIDNIAAGLEKMVGGPSATAPHVEYDLTAPRDFSGLGTPSQKQIVVTEPVSALMYETRKIVVYPEGGDDAAFAGAEWSDNIPKLLQLKITQSLENAKIVAAVARPAENLNADYRLLFDIHAFQIETKPANSAKVEISAKIIDQDGRILASQVFHAEGPVAKLDAATAAAALDSAFGKTMRDLVPWAASVISKA